MPNARRLDEARAGALPSARSEMAIFRTLLPFAFAICSGCSHHYSSTEAVISLEDRVTALANREAKISRIVSIGSIISSIEKQDLHYMQAESDALARLVSLGDLPTSDLPVAGAMLSIGRSFNSDSGVFVTPNLEWDVLNLKNRSERKKLFKKGVALSRKTFDYRKSELAQQLLERAFQLKIRIQVLEILREQQRISEVFDFFEFDSPFIIRTLAANYDEDDLENKITQDRHYLAGRLNVSEDFKLDLTFNVNDEDVATSFAEYNDQVLFDNPVLIEARFHEELSKFAEAMNKDRNKFGNFVANLTLQTFTDLGAKGFTAPLTWSKDLFNQGKNQRAKNLATLDRLKKTLDVEVAKLERETAASAAWNSYKSSRKQLIKRRMEFKEFSQKKQKDILLLKLSYELKALELEESYYRHLVYKSKVDVYLKRSKVELLRSKSHLGWKQEILPTTEFE